LADRSAESAELLFKLAFVAVFLAASTIAARTARAATVRHGGSLNQLSHEARGLIWIRAGLGLVFYAALFAWLFTSQRARWAEVDIPVVVRLAGVAALVPVRLGCRW
jgi:apolipoprotein N-acyltransferase